jgi:hypothetical protein
MSKNFRNTISKIAPSWLTTGEGERVLYSLMLVCDAFAERARLGVLARFPERAPEDALGPIGRDRRIIRGINEAAESYAARLVRWLDDWRTAGNPFALMGQLRAYCNTDLMIRTVDARGNWYTIETDGTPSFSIAQANWHWDDSASTQWSRFWVILYPPATLWTEGAGWGDADAPAWGDNDVTWGSTATAEQVASIQSIVRAWKPAGTRCVNIIIAFDPASFDPTAAVDATGMPDGLWKHWSKNVAGVQVPARLSTARYWDGGT